MAEMSRNQAIYRAVALDFDGTLLNSNHKISSNNASILRQVHATGIEILLASGRMKGNMYKVWEELNIPSWVISYNGAQILKAYEKAKEAGLNCTLVKDAGLTELEGENYTAIAIGPNHIDKCMPIVKRMRNVKH